MALRVITEPTSDPVSVAEALKQCQIDHHEDDTYLRSLIRAATRRVETTLRRAIMPQTLRLSLDRFPCFGIDPCAAIELPRPRAVSITTLTYIDDAGVQQTLASYQLDTESEPGRLLPAYGASWPSTRCQPNAVQITYVAGFTSAAVVPQTIKLAILMLVAHWYAHRESVTEEGNLSETPQAVDFLLAGERVFSFK